MIQKNEIKERSTEFAGQRKDVFAPRKKMKNSELKKYLDMFPDDTEVSMILANPRERKKYELEQVDFITDVGFPVFCITVGAESDMDAEEVAICEECEKEAEQLAGQMDINDFPEVLP